MIGGSVSPIFFESHFGYYVQDEKEKYIYSFPAGHGGKLDHFTCCDADSVWNQISVCLCDRASDIAGIFMAGRRSD